MGDVTRAKNRIKAKFRQHGIAATGTAIYTLQGREEWLQNVKRPAVRLMLGMLYQSLDAAQELHRQSIGILLKKVQTTPVYKRLLTMPGFVPVVTPIFIAIVDDPNRFANKRKLWKYAGLSVRQRYSGDPKYTQIGGSRSGNRMLKYAAMLSAHTSLRADNRFSRHYGEMITTGIDPAMAARTTARNIIATALAIWKNGTLYQDR